jgi:hypothetical protein
VLSLRIERRDGGRVSASAEAVPLAPEHEDRVVEAWPAAGARAAVIASSRRPQAGAPALSGPVLDPLPIDHAITMIRSSDSIATNSVNAGIGDRQHRQTSGTLP